MHVEEGYYGDFTVRDEFPFNLYSLKKAQYKIYWEYKRNVTSWPITIEHNEKTGYWEVYFIRPVSDQEYVEGMQSLPDEL